MDYGINVKEVCWHHNIGFKSCYGSSKVAGEGGHVQPWLSSEWIRWAGLKFQAHPLLFYGPHDEITMRVYLKKQQITN